MQVQKKNNKIAVYLVPVIALLLSTVVLVLAQTGQSVNMYGQPNYNPSHSSSLSHSSFSSSMYTRHDQSAITSYSSFHSSPGSSNVTVSSYGQNDFTAGNSNAGAAASSGNLPSGNTTVVGSRNVSVYYTPINRAASSSGTSVIGYTGSISNSPVINSSSGYIENPVINNGAGFIANPVIGGSTAGSSGNTFISYSSNLSGNPVTNSAAGFSETPSSNNVVGSSGASAFGDTFGSNGIIVSSNTANASWANSSGDTASFNEQPSPGNTVAPNSVNGLSNTHASSSATNATTNPTLNNNATSAGGTSLPPNNSLDSATPPSTTQTGSSGGSSNVTISYSDIRDSNGSTTQGGSSNLESVSNGSIQTGTNNNNNATGANTASQASSGGSLTRGMLANELYRIMGEPSMTGTVSFADVQENSQYANAVLWAEITGIMSGHGNGAFMPNNAVTREQLAAILYRFMYVRGHPLHETAPDSGYADHQTISGYAQIPVSVLKVNGVFNGTYGESGSFSPKTNVSQSESTTILQKFLEAF